MQNRLAWTRSDAIAHARRHLEHRSFPRLQMMLLVTLTGGFGLLASFTLLHLGMHSMALRYPVALLFAYGFFLFLVWLWLRTNTSDYADLIDLVPDPTSRGISSPSIELPGIRSGGGGDFAGGGAGARFDAASDVVADIATAPIDAAGKAVDAVSDSDELVIPLLVIVLAIGVALASLYVVYIAPALFAEVLVDGGLSYALMRRLHRHEPQHWLTAALRHTAVPFAVTAVFLAGTGAAMSAYAPGAASVGQVMHDQPASGGSR